MCHTYFVIQLLAASMINKVLHSVWFYQWYFRRQATNTVLCLLAGRVDGQQCGHVYRETPLSSWCRWTARLQHKQLLLHNLHTYYVNKENKN